MALLLIPISLFGLLLITGLLYAVTDAAAPIQHDIYTNHSLSPIAGFCLAEWTSGSEEKESVYMPDPYQRRSQSPIRVTLHWRSNSMSAVTDTKPSTSGEHAETSQRTTKRFSIQLPPVSSNSNRISPSAESPPKMISPKDTIEKPDANDFLVALAAQERRVLELKEELQKAETDLTKLKRQWAHHEAMRKRQEIRQQAESRRLMSSPDKDVGLMAQEMKSASELARRNSIILKPKQTPQRKVFQGGRHTRALSLLSPTSLVNRGSIWEDGEATASRSKIESGPMTASPRISASLHGHIKKSDPLKEDIVAAGKQIMGDIKEGLWTFIEDLRQATVGDEALSASRSRQTDLSAIQSAPQQAIILSSAPTPRKKSPSSKTAAPPQPPQPPPSNPIKTQPSPQTTLSPALISPPQLSSKEQPSHAPSSSSSFSFSSSSSGDEESWDNWDSPPLKSTSPSARTASMITTTISSSSQSTPRSSLR